MRRIFNSVLATAAFAGLVAGSVPVQAAESGVQTVKVALFDMSSMAGPGMMPGVGQRGMRGPGGQGGPGVYGPGMMGPGGGYGPGMMGPGGGYGPGMMGPGWNWGGGQGPGWMAQRMMGPGMMGTGMMSIRVGTTGAKAGKVRFDVTNYSVSVVHEMEVVAVDDLNAPLPYNYETAKVEVDKAKSKGEVEDVAPGSAKVLELSLPAGNYLLICNLPGHYAGGMVAPFVVTK